MYYFDGQYEVECFDHVEVTIHSFVYQGQITKLHPRLETVRVRYQDHIDVTRSGDPRTRSETVHLSQIELIQRDD